MGATHPHEIFSRDVCRFKQASSLEGIYSASGELSRSFLWTQRAQALFHAAFTIVFHSIWHRGGYATTNYCTTLPPKKSGDSEHGAHCFFIRGMVNTVTGSDLFLLAEIKKGHIQGLHTFRT